MEKIVNKVCNIVVSDNYKNFTSSVYEFNEKKFENESLNINEVYDEIYYELYETLFKDQYESFEEFKKAHSN